MKRIKNTGYRVTIAFNAENSLNGNIHTSTASYNLASLLKSYTLFNTSIKELPAAPYTTECTRSSSPSTILQLDFHSPDDNVSIALLEDLKSALGEGVFVRRYIV